MFAQLTQYNDEKNLESGWKYLLSGWFLSVIGVMGAGIVSGLNKYTTILPMADLFFFAIIGIAVILLISAMIMAIKSIFSKQGGLILLLTTFIISTLGVLAAGPVIMILNLLISGDTH